MLCDVARDCREDVVPNRSALGYPTADVVPAYLQLRDVDHTYLVPDVGKTSLHLLPVHCRTGWALHHDQRELLQEEVGLVPGVKLSQGVAAHEKEKRVTRHSSL